MSTKPYRRSKEDTRDQYRSISQATRDFKGVQGGVGPRNPDTLMPGFETDAERGTEAWFEAKEDYWDERRRKAREETDE